MTTSQRPTAGTILGGRYRLIEPMPGAGRTWRARDDIDDRALLVRMIALPEDLTGPERDEARRRALQDAAMVSRVGQACIAQVVDAVVEDGMPWVVSLLPPGPTLGDLVWTDGPMGPTRRRIGLRVLDALVAAPVPHGDLTPDDVLLGEDGQIAVTGFATTPVDGTGTPGFRGSGGRSQPGGGSLGARGDAARGRRGPAPGATPLHTGPLRPALDALLEPDPARPGPGDGTASARRRR